MVIGRDTIIGVGVQLYGNTVIGEAARIEGPTSITDSSLESGVYIRSFSVLEGAHVSEGSGAGPFARLREGTDIAPHSYVGNFVETKNTKIGSNSLACHLTYLGDTVVCLRLMSLCHCSPECFDFHILKIPTKDQLCTMLLPLTSPSFPSFCCWRGYTRSSFA